MPDSVQSLAAEPHLTRLSQSGLGFSRVALNEGALIEIDFNKIAWETA